jgi:putative transposase
VTKKYQKNEIDTPTDGDGFVVPERVSVAMAEIAGAMREGLLALAVGTGLQVMQVLMEADVTTLAGPKGKPDGPPRPAAGRGPARPRARLGHARRSAGAGAPSAGARRRRHRRTAGADL